MSGSVEMPRYQCGDLGVHALRIRTVNRHEDGTATIMPEDERYVPFVVSAAFVAQHMPPGLDKIYAGGYFVVYDDGTPTYIGQLLFEAAYTRV